MIVRFIDYKVVFFLYCKNIFIQKIMKKNFLFLLALLILSFFSVKYIQSNKSKEENIKEPIKIGATLALSGNFAYIGESELRGLQLAIDEINPKGGLQGREIQLIVEDNKGDSKEAVNNISKLLTLDNVDVIFSVFTHITTAIKESVAEKGKLMIYASTIRDVAESNSLFFRDYFDAEDSGKTLAYFLKDKGYKNFMLLTEISDQCVQFEKGITSEGIQFLGKESYDVNNLDLKTSFLKIKEKNPDAIFVCGWRHEHIIMRELKELDMIHIPTFHFVAPFLPLADTEEIQELFRKNKSASTWYGFGSGGNKEIQEKFIEKHQQKYGSKPRPDSVYAYDDMYVLFEALIKCDEKGLIKNSRCISEKLLETNYEGVGGKLTFTKKGVSNRQTLLIQATENGWVNYGSKRFTPR